MHYYYAFAVLYNGVIISRLYRIHFASDCGTLTVCSNICLCKYFIFFRGFLEEVAFTVLQSSNSR